MKLKVTAGLEDYLESIYLIQKEKKSVRVKDLAKFIGVKAPSVIEALSNLARRNLVIHERYGDVELTPKGETLAKKVYRRHRILKQFFEKILGVSSEIAEKDACKIEHCISEDSFNRMNKLIKYMCAKDQKPLLEDFHKIFEK